ncbi:MAG: DUF433 domain-containing protein [Bacteroidia bacterium]|nr:DUF433 domain-containing protein [Bacteroidia bacterium]
MVDYKKHIHSDPAIMVGKPVIRGSRITVELILIKIAGGYSFEEILEMYPQLNLEDILACVAYAAAIMGSEEVIPAV